MSTPAVIAALMQQRAAASGRSDRRFPDGLWLRLRLKDNVYTLDMMRRGAWPEENERKRWRAAFNVPAEVWEFRGKAEEFYLVSYEYHRRLL